KIKEKTYHREGFGFSLEELVVGSVGDHRGLSILLDAYLLQGQRGGVLPSGGRCTGRGLSGLPWSGQVDGRY
ncbi:MAG: hypothetical protein V3V48_02245, partial [Candidatus Aminicenantaceae bacterium]